MSTDRGPTPFGGYYHQAPNPEPIDELTEVGKGTAGGEYLRRFWHPVALATDLKDLPVRIRVLGEDLVVFRDKSGRGGLLALQCSHRGVSLEYGRIEMRGIRCCYHGWHYDIDGRLLETPAEPSDSTARARICHGAYPTHEVHGLVFAYLGPPNHKPAFPDFDSLALAGFRYEVGLKVELACNWVQMSDNSVDPAHIFFLHTKLAGAQFAEEYALPAQWDWHETQLGLNVFEIRRLQDPTKVWLNVLDYIMPNMVQFGAADPDPSKWPGWDKPTAIRWVVPQDDRHTTTFRLWLFKEGIDVDAYMQQVLTFGQEADRAYEERQRVPGDHDIFVSQGTIADRMSQNLAHTDDGVSMFRRLLRNGIEAVKTGASPGGLLDLGGQRIVTNCGNRLLEIPVEPDPKTDRKLLRARAKETVGLGN